MNSVTCLVSNVNSVGSYARIGSGIGEVIRIYATNAPVGKSRRKRRQNGEYSSCNVILT